MSLKTGANKIEQKLIADMFTQRYSVSEVSQALLIEESVVVKFRPQIQLDAQAERNEERKAERKENPKPKKKRAKRKPKTATTKSE